MSTNKLFKHQTFQTNYMDNIPQSDPWFIVENGFQANNKLEAESIFSIGNGQLKQRGNFEEYYSGETMPGSYITGNYSPGQ